MRKKRLTSWSPRPDAVEPVCARMDLTVLQLAMLCICSARGVLALVKQEWDVLAWIVIAAIWIVY